MRPLLVLAAILAFGVPACAQVDPTQDAQQVPQQPMPTNPKDWHVKVEPIPTTPVPGYLGPIPSWPPFSTDTRAHWENYSVLLRPCAIFEPAGKKYRYFEGQLPHGIKRRKKFTSTELQDIKKQGGEFRIVNAGSGSGDLDAALNACLESTARRLP